MCFEYLSLFIAIARRAETRRRLTLAGRAIATSSATFVSAAASACGGERDLSAAVQLVSSTPSASLSLALSVNHSLGSLSLLSRIITVSRRNRPGNGTHTQHASRRVLYGVPIRAAFLPKQTTILRRAIGGLRHVCRFRLHGRVVPYPRARVRDIAQSSCAVAGYQARVFVRKSRYSVFAHPAFVLENRPSADLRKSERRRPCNSAIVARRVLRERIISSVGHKTI